jgi:hypothetical protein
LTAPALARHRREMLLLLVVACTAPEDAPARVSEPVVDSGSPADSGAPDSGTGPDTASDSGADDGLRGARLDPPLAPPVFTVLDSAGVTRTEADLVGHPTVLWFFREAEGST